MADQPFPAKPSGSVAATTSDAEYLAAMTHELARLAIIGKRPKLAHILREAAMEASVIVRSGSSRADKRMIG